LAVTLFPALLAGQTSAPEPLRTSITVTETIRAEAPASVTVLNGPQLREIPGVDVDEKLRDIPGFTLFRRTSSLVAHPTTQGVSLRGLGSTGASRTLVLWDGVPVNDPFGGWVYWTQFAPEELARVEVSQGASTSVFGDRAMGGAIALVSREPERWRLVSSYEGGANGSQEVFAGLSSLWQHWAGSANVRAFTTDGYFIVPESAVGAVDRRADSQFVSGDARVDWFGGRDRVFLKLNVLAEDRGNGTRLQTNSTGLGTLSAHYARESGRNGLSAIAYHTREDFRALFTAIAADRSSERPTFRQNVPAEATGGAFYFSRRGDRVEWLAGGDAARTEGFSHDTLYPSGQRVGGGTLVEQGLFGQANAKLGPARVFLGARHDFTGLGRTFFSPSAGFAIGRGRLRARGSLYRSFRAPTLNELYRQFRVGNTVTQANPNLRPETLFGGETGVSFSSETATASLTAYRDSLSGLITNVTLSAAPDLIVRQRQNAAAAVARGVEADFAKHWRFLSAAAGYLFADSRFASGGRIPQVPRHQGSARLGFEGGGTAAWLGVRSYGSQFEDERNLRSMLLPGYASVQLYARRKIARGLAALAEIENLLDREYITGFTPTPMIGPRRLWRAGLRWEGRI
jgi:outer membrane receptor protein involved in Fe transport